MSHSAVALKRLAGSDLVLTGLLLTLAGAGWWWSVQMAQQMSAPMTSGAGSIPMSLGAFVVGWIAMMAAMMLPAVVPVVRLYARAARAGTVAPAPVFVTGYLLVWGAVGLPAWWAWHSLAEPIAAGAPAAARAAGAALVLAGLYQLSPAKRSCLRHCRSPMGFFLRLHGDLRSPHVALRAGAAHGTLCLGCCWALMAVLVAVGTMHLGWMLALAALIFVEKVVPRGELIGRAVAVGLVPLGAALLAQPALIGALT